MRRSCIRGLAAFVIALWCAIRGAREASSAPSLDIVGSENSTLSFTTDRSKLELRFTIVTQNTEPVGDLQVIGTPFRDAAGNTQPTDLPTPDKTPFHDQLTVALTASFPIPGEYKAVLALIYGGARHAFTIKVVRSLPPPLKDMPLTTVGATLSAIVLSSDNAVAKLVVRNDGTDVLTLKPVAASLAQMHNTDLLSTGAGVTAKLDRQLVNPGDSVTVTINLSQLSDAGKYQGRIHFTDDQGRYKPIDMDFALLVKRPGWCAAALIGAGVLMSFIFKQIFDKRSKLLVARRDLARVRERCVTFDRSDLKERERSVIAAVLRQLDELTVDAQLGLDADRHDALARISRKLDVIAFAVEIARVIELLDPAKAAVSRQTLDSVASRLVDPRINLDELNKAYSELRELKTRTDLRAALNVGITTVAAMAKAQRASAPAEMTAQLDELDRIIARSSDLHATDALDAAIEQYNLARIQLAAILAALLDSRLKNQFEPFETDAWQELVLEIKPLLQKALSAPPDEKIAAYREAQAVLYLRSFEAIAARAEKLADQRPAHKKPLSNFATNVRSEANASARADDAAARFSKAMAELIQLDKQSSSDAQTFKVSATTRTGWLPEAIPGDISTSRPVDTWRALQRTIDRSDWVAFGGLLVISVLTGVQLLWTGDATWGSFDSKLLAFLWGLGIHAVGNQPFKNIFHLSSLLTSPPSG